MAGRSPSAGAASRAARANMRPAPTRSARRWASTARCSAAGIIAPAHPTRRAKAPRRWASGYYYRGTLANGAVRSGRAAGGWCAGRLPRPGRSAQQRPAQPVQRDPDRRRPRRAQSRSRPRAPTLYGGQYEVKQFDGSVSGPLFDLFGKRVQAAVGVDYRRETYSFNGSDAGCCDRAGHLPGGVRQRQRADAQEADGEGGLWRSAGAAGRPAGNHRRDPRRRLHRLRDDHQSEDLGQVSPDRSGDVPRFVQHRVPGPVVQPDLQRHHHLAQSGQHVGRPDALPARAPSTGRSRAARRSPRIR